MTPAIGAPRNQDMDAFGGVDAHVHGKTLRVRTLLVGSHGAAPWSESRRSDFGTGGRRKRV